MLQWLGINKYQKDEILKTTENSKHNSFIMIGDIKKVFACITPGYNNSDPLNISNFSNETFDKVLEGVLYVKEMGEICHWNNSNIESIIYLLNSITELDDEKKTNTKRIIYDLKKYVEKLDIDYFVINTYNDYLRMLRRLDGSAGKMPLYFANRDELTRFHDAAVAVYNVKRNEVCNEAFKKQLKKIVSYQYESDKFDFIVISPTEANDLAYEGATLHHCVKSYVERVANGSTNIMFIRKKDDPDKPFFTVEVTNQKIIAQVHGFANRNANTEPALTEFIEDWAKKKGLTIGNINMVR